MSSPGPTSESTPLLAENSIEYAPAVATADIDPWLVYAVRLWRALLALAIAALTSSFAIRITMLILNRSTSGLPWSLHDTFTLVPALSAVSAILSAGNLSWLRLRRAELPHAINILGHLILTSGILFPSFDAIGDLLDNQVFRRLPFIMIFFLWTNNVVCCVLGLSHLFLLLTTFASWWAQVWSFLTSIRLPRLAKPQTRILHTYRHRERQTSDQHDVDGVRDAVAQAV